MILTKFIKTYNKELLNIIKPKAGNFVYNSKCFVGPHCYRYIYSNYNGVNILKKMFAEFYKIHYPNEYENELNFIFSDTMQLYPNFKDKNPPYEFTNNCKINIKNINKYEIISRKDDPHNDDGSREYNNVNDYSQDYYNDVVYNFFSNLK